MSANGARPAGAVMMESGAGVSVREALPADLERWDTLVRSFPNHRVVHTRAWVESLEAAGLGRPLYLLFEKDGEVVGCLPGLLASVAGLRLFGSPLAGWQTVSMGPAFDPARLSTADLLGALLPILEGPHRVSYMELLHHELDPEVMRAFGFRGQPVFTYRAPLFPGNERRMLGVMHESARRNVRRAERLGLVARFEEDEAFVTEHYKQLREVYVRGGQVIPFSERRMQECFRRMKAAGNLVAAAVYLPGGRVSIATGIFLIEGRELLLWSWAHQAKYRWYRPTELMTWTVMRRAMAAGCNTFDLMGRGDFKTKFGAEPDETKWRWIRGRPRWLTQARVVAEAAFRFQQTVRGQAERLVGKTVGTLAERGARHDGAVACVLGDMDLVRPLALARIPCVVAAPPGAPARFSRATREVLEWVDPWERPDNFLETLLEHGAAQPEPPVLFYQDDRALLLASRHRERLLQSFRFVIPDAQLVEDLVDKARFQKLAARLKLPVPPARALFPAQEPPPARLDLEPPLILKPLTRRPDRWEPVVGQCKAIRLDTAEALRTLWPHLAEAGMPVLAQSLVPGPETRMESYHVYMDEAGKLVAEFTGRKIRTRPAAFGDSTALEITDAPDVTKLGREIVGRLGLRGVAKLDFKRGPDGRLYLLEVNPRFTLWHHPAALAGVNIPALVYDNLVGRSRPPVARARAGVRWCKVWSDYPAARADGMPLVPWLRWALGCEAMSGLAWDDPFPLIRAAVWRWRESRRPAPPPPQTPTRSPELRFNPGGSGR